jgi:hypothetical protein
MRFRSLIASLFLVAPAFAQVQNTNQTWYLPSSADGGVQEGNTVTFTSTVTVRYGQLASKCAAVYGTCAHVGDDTVEAWSAPVTIVGTAEAPVTITVNSDYFGGDPVPGVYKTIQIAETTAPQMLTAGSSTFTVPALAPPPAPPILPPTQIVAADGTLTVTMPPGYGIPVGQCRVGSAGSLYFILCNGPIGSNGTDANSAATGDNSTATK